MSFLHRLWILQNAAARLLTGTLKTAHIPPALSSIAMCLFNFSDNFESTTVHTPLTDASFTMTSTDMLDLLLSSQKLLSHVTFSEMLV